eukprot:CAMPEP_0174916148 /NCGR_PEP_ID=MMETSP1355-20121228/1587_1 /TAXON_ID=464990 /ORGANISM="Hemiselmis tepida, Strain CCMP443" /LENGTH=120 /DNA_ID=CAMNT_0016161125 /DNA_START=144 /DNA_END=501 /DNA_ORIENTATION=-
MSAIVLRAWRQQAALEPLAEVEGALLVVEVLHLPHPELSGLLHSREHFCAEGRGQASATFTSPLGHDASPHNPSAGGPRAKSVEEQPRGRRGVARAQAPRGTGANAHLSHFLPPLSLCPA